jgi:hypothetical protein
MSFLCGFFVGVALCAVSISLVMIADFIGWRRSWFGHKTKVVGKKGNPFSPE